MILRWHHVAVRAAAHTDEDDSGRTYLFIASMMPHRHSRPFVRPSISTPAPALTAGALVYVSRPSIPPTRRESRRSQTHLQSDVSADASRAHCVCTVL